MLSSASIASIPAVALALVAALTLLLPAALTYFLVQHTGSRAKLRARLADISAGGGAQHGKNTDAARRARQIQSKLRDAGKSGRSLELRLRIERAGLSLSLRNLCLMGAASGLAGTAIYLLLGFAPLFAPAVFAVMGVGLPHYVLGHMARRRQRRFTELFADAIDVIVRGIRSGLPVAECLNIIAQESPEPVSGEFRRLVEEQRLGTTLKQALDRASQRMPTADMRFFAVVLNLQRQTGGNLAETLNGLSNVLRGRKKMAAKIRAMSSEARMTAIIIGSLPFLVSGVIYLINPDYITLLWTEPFGRMILYGGLGWMTLGTLIMKQMISFEV